jgi:transcription-repair coupling factor (superfamily II helicase)
LREAKNVPTDDLTGIRLLKELPQRVDRLPGFDALLSVFDGSQAVGQIEGLAGGAKGLVLARTFERRGGQMLVVTYQTEQAQRLWDDLRHFGVPEDRLFILPASEGRWLSNDVTDYRALGERIAALSALGRGDSCIVIGTAEAVFQRTSPPEDILGPALTIRSGETIHLDKLLPRLIEMGYEAETTVARPGQYSKRGGILDIFPSTADTPVRLELFGDEIESLRAFDVATQRSIGKRGEVHIAPVREVRLTTERVNNAIVKIRAALQERKLELVKQKNREAFDQINERVEDDIIRLQNGVYFDGLEEYLGYLVPEELCALDYVGVGYQISGDGKDIGAGYQVSGDGKDMGAGYQVSGDRKDGSDRHPAPDTRNLVGDGKDSPTRNPAPDTRNLIVIDEPGQVRAHWERLATELGASRERRYERGELLEGADHSSTCTDGMERAGKEFSALVLTQLSRNYEGFSTKHKLTVSTSVMENYRSRLQFFADEIGTWLANGADCLLVSDQPHRVREICAELKLPTADEKISTNDERPTTNDDGTSEPLSSFVDGHSSLVGSSSLVILEGRLRQGFKFADIGLYVATDAELFGSTRPVIARKRATGGIPISTILDLRENDFVVHIHHGIGVYRGLVKRHMDNADRDFLHIQYNGGDSLYVPADQIDRIQRYIGGEGTPPTVNRIGGNEWARSTRRVKEQAKEMAKELIELYAARQAAERPSLGGDTPWQQEMEDAFPYDETPSQMRAIEDVKADLEEHKPMDRLVCGDVGFGKTEVAIRAAFKVVEAGKQVAVLCPTTVLAAQHHTTFSERLAAYPARVELLSRFRSRQEQKKTIEELKVGAVDIVIGTHRLLSKDVAFSNLGLIIVDEEQRFGVTHKERLKQLRKTVDVLTLTATPIPRTLSMALSGLRDMSVIEDPPSGRMPIVTYVREYDDDLVKNAILRELERDGQIYFVHNRIESIAHVAQRIQRLVPDARIVVGHGQMSEDELEKLMYAFYHQEYDILVCTTIIENGLDVPNVNTIIVDNADRMGLAQLYQLRGRVGRSNRQAYAYLMFRANKQLSEDAERRLFAIREFTALGSGFQIAMRDLEIRGAGNLLGAEQSGAIVTVGYDLYCQLLAQAVTEAKGEEPADDVLPPVDIPITAHIPEEYIPNEAERIFFYKKMSTVRSVQDISGLQEELEDRYGDPPKPVWSALAVLRLRLRAKEAGIASIRGERTEVVIRFGSQARLTPDAIRLLTHLYKKHKFTGDSVTFKLISPRIMEEIEGVMDVLEQALEQSKKELAGRR